MNTSTDRADARLRHAIQLAEESGDLRTWLNTVASRHGRLTRRGSSQAELAELRRPLLERADDLRAGLRSRVGRLWAGRVVDRAFGRVLHDVLEQPGVDPAEIFTITEACKARTLLDIVAGHFREPSLAAAEELAASERELLRFGASTQEGVVYEEMMLGSELAIGPGEPDRSPPAWLQAVEDAYAARDAGFIGVAAPPALERVAATLAPNELLVEYVIPYHATHPAFGVWILAVRPDGVRLLPAKLDYFTSSGIIGRLTVDDQAPIDTSPLGTAIVEVRAAIQRGEDAVCAPLLARLHGALIEPLIEASLDPSRFDLVTIVPQRVLHPVPWAALTGTDGRRLIEQTALALSPSAAVWLSRRTGARAAVSSCLAFANPQLADEDPLPDAEDEVDRVADALAAGGVTTDALRGHDASETMLVEKAAGRGLVYFATHGAFPETDAYDFHYLLLARTDRDDGYVAADTIRRLDLAATWLVVMSICDGGLYRFGPGDEPQGMLPAFFAAGAENVIATLWEIGDRAGRDLMVRAAPHLLPEGPARALRHAVLEVLQNPGVSIRDWAGYVVAGSGLPPVEYVAHSVGDPAT